MAPAQAPAPSPGEAYSSPGVPPMVVPHLDFVYRIVCEMDPGITTIAGVQAAAVDRLVLPIARGVVRGPRIRGTIVPNSGADWAQLVRGEKASSRAGGWVECRSECLPPRVLPAALHSRLRAG